MLGWEVLALPCPPKKRRVPFIKINLRNVLTVGSTRDLIHFDSALPFMDKSCSAFMSDQLANIFESMAVDLLADNQSELTIKARAVDDWWLKWTEGHGYSKLTAVREIAQVSNHALLALSLSGEVAMQAKRSYVAKPREISLNLWDWEVGDAVESRGDFALLCIFVPQSYLLKKGLENIPLGQTIAAEHGSGRVLAATMSRLMKEMLSSKENESVLQLLPAFTDFALTTFKHANTKMQTPAKQLSKLHKIQQHLNINLGDPELSTEYVSKHLGISPRQISREFKVIEETFSGYLRRIRMDRACVLLEQEPTKPIAQVAKEVGFSSSTVFGRVFKEFYGMTPKEYLKTQ